MSEYIGYRRALDIAINVLERAGPIYKDSLRIQCAAALRAHREATKRADREHSRNVRVQRKAKAESK